MTQNTNTPQRSPLRLAQVGPGWRSTLLIVAITVVVILIGLGVFFAWQSDKNDSPTAAPASTASELVNMTEHPKPVPSVTHWTLYNGEAVQFTRPKDEVGPALRQLDGELETLASNYCLLMVEAHNYDQPSEVLRAAAQELRETYTLQLVNYRLLLVTEQGKGHFREYLPLDEEVRYGGHIDCEPLQPEQRGPVLKPNKGTDLNEA